MRCPACGRRWRDSHPCPEAVAPPALTPGRPPHIPEHEVIRELGRGGFGEVWLARAGDGHEVAIKIAHAHEPSAAARLVREREALAMIGPPHVPAVRGAGVLADGRAFLAMDFIAAPTLAERMADGPPALADVERIMTALVPAVAAAHRVGVTHRDLKPENIFLAPDGARLVDFGLARGTAEASVTASGLALGTAVYMAPEQVRGGEVGPAADVYALAVILFELCAGRPPFFGAEAEVRLAHESRRPPRLGELVAVPAALDEVLAGALAKSPARRPRDAAAFADALAGAFTGRAGKAVEAATRVRVPAMVIVFDSRANLGAITSAIAAESGEMLSARGGRFAAAFTGVAAQDRAERAARALLDPGLAAGVWLDRAELEARVRDDGSRRLSPPPLAEISVGAGLQRRAGAPAPKAAGPAVPEDVPFVGREELLAALVAAQASRIPTIATVSGGVGLGKTRLLGELAGRLAGRVVTVPLGEPLAGEVYPGLRALARGVLELPDSTPPDAGQALLTSRLGGDGGWAAVAMVLGWLAPDAPALAPVRAAPGVARAVAVNALARAFERRAPLAILVDDAHLMDPAGLEALEQATLAEHASPILVCLAGREAARGGVGERAGTRLALALPPLAPGEAAQLCRALFAAAEELPADVVADLAARTGGVPLLCVELARAAVAAGLWRARTQGKGWYLATDELDRLHELPLAEWAARRDVDGLGDELRAHAARLALLGADVDEDVAELILGTLELGLDPRVATRRLVDLGVVVLDGARLGFANPVTRDVLARGLAAADRRRVHAAAARIYRGRADRELPRLAYHVGEAGQSAEAARLFLELGDRARDRHDYLAGERMYSRALDSLADDDTRHRLRARRGRALMRYRLGRYADSLEDHERARELARELGDLDAEVDLLLDEATALDWMGEIARSAAMVEEATARIAGVKAPLLAVRLDMARGRVRYRGMDLRGAATILRDVAERASALGDPAYETLVAALMVLLFILPVAGHVDEAVAVGERLTALCEARGDRLHVASALSTRLNVHVARGRVDLALADLERVVQLGRELGVVITVYRAELSMAWFLYTAGDLEAAAPHLQRAMELERRAEGIGHDTAHLIRAQCLAYVGDEVGARAALADLRVTTLMSQELLLRDLVELCTRDATAAEWADLRARLDFSLDDIDPIEVVEQQGLAALRRGRHDEARALLDEALALASRFPNIIRARVARSRERLASGQCQP